MGIKRARELRKQMPPAEAAMWNALRALKPLGLHFRRQVPLGRYFADFACHHPKLVIEVDGDTHVSESYDAERDRFMEREGYRVLRVSNRDVLDNLDGVIETVLNLVGR
jgi:very-short-patch-repair endonuclease